MAAVVIAFKAALVAEPALRRGGPVRASGPPRAAATTPASPGGARPGGRGGGTGRGGALRGGGQPRPPVFVEQKRHHAVGGQGVEPAAARVAAFRQQAGPPPGRSRLAGRGRPLRHRLLRSKGKGSSSARRMVRGRARRSGTFTQMSPQNSHRI